MNDTNVILIVFDTLRADHLGCYGYFRDTSPNIDGLAGEGILFEDYYNSGVPTGPGFTSIFTGLYPLHHRFYKFNSPNVRQVDDKIFTIAEIMQQLGFTTVALDNLISMLSKAKHYVRGYDYYINVTRTTGFSAILAEQVNKGLFDWLEQHSEEQFFLFIHYWDPHLPYNTPKEYRNRFHHEKGSLSGLEVRKAPVGYDYVQGWGEIRQIKATETNEEFVKRGLSIDLYDGEIAYLDQAIGKVISKLEDKGIFDNSLLILTSDHGEQLGQHYDTWVHGGLHSSVTHLPLIIRWPRNLSGGKRVKGFCQQIDILPTVLDFLDVPEEVAKEGLGTDGDSVGALLKNGNIRNQIFIESAGGTRATRDKDWLLIDNKKRRNRELELYDVNNDPMEIINLAKTREEKAGEYRNSLHRWVEANIREGEQDPTIYNRKYNGRGEITKYRDARNKLRKYLPKKR